MPYRIQVQRDGDWRVIPAEGGTPVAQGTAPDADTGRKAAYQALAAHEDATSPQRRRRLVYDFIVPD
jgi:hypothetical protein